MTTAFILTATDKVTGTNLYYMKGDTFPETTETIWFAKFYMANGKGVRKALANLTKNASRNYKNGHVLEWKIQEVSMNAPTDLD